MLLALLPNATVSLILANISASLDIASFSIALSSPLEAKIRDGFSATERSPLEADVTVMLPEIAQILSSGLRENGGSPL